VLIRAPGLKETPKENHGYSGSKGAPSTGVRLKRRIQGVFPEKLRTDDLRQSWRSSAKAVQF
jgi:hypothetical protein